MHIRQRIFKCTDMQLYIFFLEKILKLSETPFFHEQLRSYQLSKTVCFSAHPVMCFTFVTKCVYTESCMVGMSDINFFENLLFLILLLYKIASSHLQMHC